MGQYTFTGVKICGIKSSLPKGFIDIDDEINYFGYSPKKLERAKKIIGYGRRYIADNKTTVLDLAVDAATKLMSELSIFPHDIDLLVFVNQKTDYPEPSDACISHGILGLEKECSVLHINSGCSGYIQGLWTAHAMISAGCVNNCLLLAGDLCAKTTDQTNRKLAPVFSDSASATFLASTDDKRKATFILGCDGTGWDKIIHPIGGMRIPNDPATANIKWTDRDGNTWTPMQGMMKGEDVFNFSIDIAPKLLKNTMYEAGWMVSDVDLFAIHQANKQILQSIIKKSGIPTDRCPSDIFTKYANNSTNSVVTVLCDQPKDAKLDKVILCAFGIGLSWGGAALDLSGMYNGGFSTYVSPVGKQNRVEQIEHWKKYFEGEEE